MESFKFTLIEEKWSGLSPRGRASGSQDSEPQRLKHPASYLTSGKEKERERLVVALSFGATPMFFTGSPTKQGLLYKQSESTCSRICALLCSTYSIFKDMIRPCPWEEKKTFVETFKAEDGPRPRHCLAAGSPATSLPHIMASSPEKICCLVSLWKNSSFITKLASVWCRWKFTHTWKHTVKSKN